MINLYILSYSPWCITNSQAIVPLTECYSCWMILIVVCVLITSLITLWLCNLDQIWYQPNQAGQVRCSAHTDYVCNPVCLSSRTCLVVVCWQIDQAPVPRVTSRDSMSQCVLSTSLKFEQIDLAYARLAVFSDCSSVKTDPDVGEKVFTSLHNSEVWVLVFLHNFEGVA